ncbi:MAG TPA: flagellar basal-body MS-ring/collar protein FliF [Candidatus Hydrogenedentes bacterium]|nr:flagellar basal-body MS-ring/collar protein FliF [Candidatus Hydrogenedentota bacterium]
MFEFVRQFLAGLVLAWDRLSASARVTVAVAFIFTVAIIAGIVTLGSRPQYVELFSGLSSQDMVAVQGRLDQEGVPWKIDSTGKVISVPLQNRSDMLVKINGAGLVTSQGGIPGFEIFDSANLMQTQFTQDVNLLRAKTGELQQLLGRFSFIRGSYVSIGEAKDELFTQDEKPTEATVTLDVIGSLNEEQVKAVLNTVSSAIAGLSREHINLATTDGKILHAPAESGFDSIATSKFDLARTYRNELKREAERSLASLGVRSVVTLSLDVDHSTRKETTESVKEGVPLSTYLTENSTKNIDVAPQGPAGARANLPEDAQSGGSQGIEQTQTMEIQNMEPSRTTTETVTTPGTVKVLGATAIVEGKYEDELDEQGAPTGKKNYVERTKEELEKYKDLVAMAVGVSNENITISDHPFELAQLATAMPSTGEVAAPASGLPFGTAQLDGIIKAVAIILLFFVVRFLALRATVRKERMDDDVAIDLPTASPEEMRKREMATEVERVSQEQPETVASLLRTWLNEPEE